MVQSKEVLHFSRIQSALNFLRLIAERVGEHVNITLDLIPEEDNHRAAERLFRQLENVRNDPTHGHCMVVVFERTYVNYVKVQRQLHEMETRRYHESAIGNYKHELAKYWSREINIDELRYSTYTVFRQLRTAYDYKAEVPTETKLFYAYWRDVEMKLNGDETLIGVFTTVQLALDYIDTQKDRYD